MTKKLTITLDEIDAALAGPSIAQCTFMADAPEGTLMQRTQWVEDLSSGSTPRLRLEDLMDLAAEAPDGPLAAIQGLLRGLIVRHQHDDVTLAALVAIERLHLPCLTVTGGSDA